MQNTQKRPQPVTRDPGKALKLKAAPSTLVIIPPPFFARQLTEHYFFHPRPLTRAFWIPRVPSELYRSALLNFQSFFRLDLGMIPTTRLVQPTAVLDLWPTYRDMSNI